MSEIYCISGFKWSFTIIFPVFSYLGTEKGLMDVEKQPVKYVLKMVQGSVALYR